MAASTTKTGTLAPVLRPAPPASSSDPTFPTCARPASRSAFRAQFRPKTATAATGAQWGTISIGLPTNACWCAPMATMQMRPTHRTALLARMDARCAMVRDTTLARGAKLTPTARHTTRCGI